MTLTMWMITLWAVFLPFAAMVAGWLRPRRDVFLLLLYAQSIIYIDVAPILASVDVNDAMRARYVWVQAWVLVLFQLPLIVIYCLALRWRRNRYAPERQLHVSPVRLGMFTAACVIHGIAYFSVAARYGLLYRRIAEDLATVQLSMNLVDFALYRSFIELGPFLIGAQLLVLRARTAMSRSLRMAALAGLLLTTALFLAYAIVNTRLFALVTIAMILGVTAVTGDDRKGLRVRTVVGIGLAAVASFYAISVREPTFAHHSHAMERCFRSTRFSPFSSEPAAPDDSYRWRLNGIDLIAIIADNVESHGPALGTAWAVPFVLALDPIVRTPFSVDAKRANLTATKTWLLLCYVACRRRTHAQLPALGRVRNFSIYGFALSALCRCRAGDVHGRAAMEWRRFGNALRRSSA